MPDKRLNILSLGAGVQSSTLAFMGEYGDLDIDCAIFSDTKGEPASVYAWLKYLQANISYPIYVVNKGDLAADAPRVIRSKKSGKLYMKGLIPAFVKNHDGSTGLLGRRCTEDYKIVPIQRKVRELLGIKRATKNSPTVDMMVGISTDEAHRMKPSRSPSIVNTWPLIDMNMNRNDCLAWMKKHELPEPPRSSCVYCPFHGDDEWRKLVGTPDFDKAVAFERALQAGGRKQETLKGLPYLHRSCKPLDEIDFADLASYQQLDLFGNECEGLCGV